MHPSRNADILAAGGASGRIEVEPNSKANGRAPWYEEPNDSMVSENEQHIIEMAKKYGVDPDLIRSTVFMESTHGGYLGLGPIVEAFGLAKSRLPMNLNTRYWGDT